MENDHELTPEDHNKITELQMKLLEVARQYTPSVAYVAIKSMLHIMEEVAVEMYEKEENHNGFKKEN